MLDYLIQKYGYDEPIFLDELSAELQELVDESQLQKYDDGIYFIQNPNKHFSKGTLSVSKIINRRYIYNGEATIGYVTGLSFANSIRLTTQNPACLEIVTMNTERNVVVEYKTRSVSLRKPMFAIDESNYRVLQVLDLLNSLKRLTSRPNEFVRERIIEYVVDHKVSKEDMDKYLGQHSDEVINKVKELRLYDEMMR